MIFFSSMIALSNRNQENRDDYLPAKSIFKYAQALLQRRLNSSVSSNQSVPLDIFNSSLKDYSIETQLLSRFFLRGQKSHPAAPDPTFAPTKSRLATSCNRSFEPICDMYSYVRFWNKRFTEIDCYKSPLTPPKGKCLIS